MPAAPLVAALLVLAACNPGDRPSGPPGGGPSAERAVAPRSAPPSAPVGGDPRPPDPDPPLDSVAAAPVGDPAPLSDAARYARSKAVIDAGRPAIRRCVDRRLGERPDLDGRFEAVWSVRSDGVPYDVRIAPLDEPDRALESCMGAAVAAWRFPQGASAAPLRITYVVRGRL